MHQLMRKMRRQCVIRLLLACLLLSASQHPYFLISVEAVESAHFRYRRGQFSLRNRNERALPGWKNQVEGQKIHKRPSGPNPVGNHRPPFKR